MTNISTQATTDRETARASDGKFGHQAHDRASGIDLSVEPSTAMADPAVLDQKSGALTHSHTSSFEERYRAKLSAASDLQVQYEKAGVEASEMSIEAISRYAAEAAPAEAVAVGIAAEYDDEPERSEDTLRGLRWIHADGAVHDLDGDGDGDGDMVDRFHTVWGNVDRRLIPWHAHAGLIERQDSGLPTDALKRDEVEYVIPIRGRDHGMEEPPSSPRPEPAAAPAPPTAFDVGTVRQQAQQDLDGRFGDDQQHERTLARTQMAFGALYDDEPGEPDQAVRDAMADLMHVSAARGVDFEQALAGASRTWSAEREEWGID